MNLASKIFGPCGAVGFTPQKDGSIEVRCINGLNKKESFVKIGKDHVPGFEAWLEGELIQNAMPFLSSSDRELMISGINSEDWDSMFKEED
jgi:hypothetical protein